MKIDIHNYQPWLMLYLDGELTAEEKKEVENFLLRHPEFNTELDALYMTLQVPDLTLACPDKESLYKNISAETFITPQNRQEIFTLYHDNELSSEEREKVEIFVAAYPSFRDEFIFVQKLRMVPDSASTFPEINSLYRPKRAYRVLQMNRWSMAAASLLLILSIQVFRFFLVTSPDKEGSVIIATPTNNSKGPVKNIENETLITAEQSTRIRSVQDDIKSTAFARKEKITSKTIPAASTSNEVQAPHEAAANENSSVVHTADIAITAPAADINIPPQKEPAASVQQVAEMHMESNPIINTSYAEKADIPWEEEYEEKSVIQRNKGLKVFMRKMNRAMERIGIRENEKEKHKTMVHIASIKIGIE